MKKLILVTNNTKNEIIFKGTEQDYVDFCKQDEKEIEEQEGYYSYNVEEDLFRNKTPFGECSSDLEVHKLETNEDFIFMVYPQSSYRNKLNISFYTFERVKDMIESYKEDTGNDFEGNFEKVDINNKQEIISLALNTIFLATDEEYVDKMNIY